MTNEKMEKIIRNNKPKSISYYFELTEYIDLLKPYIKRYISKKRKEKEICNLLTLICEMVFYGSVDERGEYHLYMDSLGIDENIQKELKNDLHERIHAKLSKVFNKRIDYDSIESLAIYQEGREYCGIIRVANDNEL